MHVKLSLFLCFFDLIILVLGCMVKLHQGKLQQQAGLSVMRMAMGGAAEQSNSITAMASDTSKAMESSMRPYLGAVVDITGMMQHINTSFANSQPVFGWDTGTDGTQGQVFCPKMRHGDGSYVSQKSWDRW